MIALVFKEPVTLDVFLQACAALGVDSDRVLDDPTGTLTGFDVPLSRIQAFLDVVLLEPVSLGEMDLDQTDAIGSVAVADFFLDLWQKRAGRRAQALLRSTEGPVFPRAKVQA